MTPDKIKALLLIPPSDRYMRETRCQAPLDKVMVECVRSPISLAYIAGILHEQGIVCEIRDSQAEKLSWQDVADKIKFFMPNTLIMQVTIPTFEQDAKVYELAKSINKNITTIAFGGLSEEAISIVEACDILDIFVYEEPEYAFSMLARGESFQKIPGIAYKESGHIYNNFPPLLMENLDTLPFPERTLLDNRLYCRPDTGRMQTELKVSRGCSGECIFCLAPLVHGKKIRKRSPQNIVDEIERCVNDLAIKDFFFRADTFTWDKDWVMALCQEIMKRNLRISWCCNSRVDTIDRQTLNLMEESGCWLISFGIESGSQKILDRIKKNIALDECRKAVRLCNEVGIKTYLNFMIGFPWDDKNTIHETLRFARELNGDMVEFPLLNPFPGTEIHKFCIEKGLIKDKELMIAQLPVPTLYLSSEEVFSLWRKAVLSYYCRPSFIFRTLSKAMYEKTFFNYMRFGFKKIINIYSQN